jgi:AAA domain-containing protein
MNRTALRAIAKLRSRLPGGVLAVLGMGVDDLTAAAAPCNLAAAPSNQRLLSLGVLWPAEVDRICAEEARTQFLIEDFLPATTLAIAAGESTIGKSALICQLGLCVAAGQPFLGMPTAQGRVLYFDLENSLLDCKRMRDSLMRHLGLPDAPPDFLLVPSPPEHLERVLDGVGPKLVVIDSLRSFRPDVTDKNRNAGEWIKDIRRMSRKCKCAFLIVHHLRKPGENVPSPLKDSTVSDWLQAMEGPRGFFNQTDVRIAIAASDGRANNPSDLDVKWVRRTRGDSPLVSVERVFDEYDEPRGYRHLVGPGLLDPEKRVVFDRLPQDFSTADAKAARRAGGLGDGNDPTNKFLAECKHLRIIERTVRGRWRKTAA